MTDNLIDLERLQNIFGDDHANIAEFLQIYLSETIQLLSEIESAINQNNIELSKKLFHRLKGSSGNSGIPRLYELAIEAEAAVTTENWAQVLNYFQMIKDVFKQLQNEVIKKEWTSLNY